MSDSDSIGDGAYSTNVHSSANRAEPGHRGSDDGEKPRLNKAGNRRGMHNNRCVRHLPVISEQEETQFHDTAFDTSLRTKRFKFNLHGHNVRNFIHAVIKSPLVQDLLSKEFLNAGEAETTVAEEKDTASLCGDMSVDQKMSNQGSDFSLIDVSESLCSREKVMKYLTEQRITRNRKRQWPKECIESIDPLLAFISESGCKQTEATSGSDSNPNELPGPSTSNDEEICALEFCTDETNLDYKTNFESHDSGAEETIAYRTRNKLNLEGESIEQFELPIDFEETENLLSRESAAPKKRKSDELQKNGGCNVTENVANDTSCHVILDDVGDHVASDDINVNVASNDVRDHVTLDEEDDDVTWKQWLSELMTQGEVEHRNWDSDSYDSDPDFDYNFCADKAGADDDERIEKGSHQFEIEIPQDEKEMLVREALNYLGIKNPVDLPMICKTLVLPKILRYDSKTNQAKNRYDDSLNLNLESLHAKLKQQLQMHTQLITQHFLSFTISEKWEKRAEICQTWITDLVYTQSEISSYLIICNLKEAEKLVNYPFNYKKDDNDAMPNSLLRIFLYSEVFMYRELLPYTFFNPSDTSKSIVTQRVWSDPEDCVIALGLSDIGGITNKRGQSIFTLRRVCLYISEHMLPIREPIKILRRCYYLLNKATPNPVKFFSTYKTLPELPQDVAFLSDQEVVAPIEMKTDDPGWPLPMWMQVLMYLDKDQGLEFVLERQKDVCIFSQRLRRKLESDGITCKEDWDRAYGSETQIQDFQREDLLNVSCEILCPQEVEEPAVSVAKKDFRNPSCEDKAWSNDDDRNLLNGSSESSSKSPEFPIIVSSPSKVSRSFKFTKSPAKLASDKLVKRAIRTSLASPDKVVKRNSKSAFKSLSLECESVRHHSKGLKLERPVLITSKAFLGKDHSRNIERSSAVRRLIRKRKNWHQARKSYNSAMAYFKQSLYPQTTPEVESRIQSLREEIFSKIYDQLGFEKYSVFLEFLRQICSETIPSRAKFLAGEIKSLFVGSKRLYEELAKLVPRSVSFALGLFFQYESFMRARSFLHKVEASCKDNAKQFNIILDTFASSARDETTIWNNVTPLLEFNPYLIDEFTLLFPNEPVPECFRGPFEEIIITEDDEKVEDSATPGNDITSNETENPQSSGLRNRQKAFFGCDEMGSNPSPSFPVFEEIVLLDDDVEALVREKAVDGSLEKKQNRSGTLNIEHHNNQCIMRNIMQAKHEQVVKRRIDGPISPKKAKRPATPHSSANDQKTS